MALQAGRLFGNYRITRLLGEGGFGEVYLAEHPLIERRAAVKVLHAALAKDTELVRRFLNEARAASGIRHRNIIEVFDAGVTPEGAPYILMEFLEGESLQKRLADKGRLSVPEVLEIACQAGSALTAAHSAGIVHRDLKPENLFLVPDTGAPGGERVKILDFGIAKVRRSGGTGGTLKTQTGLIMGSPAYMSPEQCRDSADVDLRSDIYSFAIIVYEALAGRLPYVAASGTEMLVMHLTATPVALRERVADLPGYVEAAVMRALSRAREERFDTVAAFVGALRGDDDRGVAASEGPSSSARVAAVATSPLARIRQEVAVQTATTFSRTSGEVEQITGDDAVVAVAQNRRWPFLVLGGAAVAGLTLFLLVPARRDFVASATTGGSALGSANLPFTVRPEPPASPTDFPNRADAGTVRAAALPLAEPSHARGAGALAGKRTHVAEKPSMPPPANQKGDSEEQWIAH